ncbi:NADH-cytochrome b5 reductase 2 [Zalerion maritima]|uniref:NADH-cytochrome b5 reductase n=1 Tax=Zalerion maritima TaxID=339359 RepID=A0AAD5RYZ1_9PEZI|nr:NADH-cytochrome b5 reductase 2 [Zalerion maritima]
MFARTAFRAAQPLRQQARRSYASGSSAGTPWGKALLLGGGVTMLGLGGYAYTNTSVPQAKAAASAAAQGEGMSEFLTRSGTSTEGMTPYLKGGEQGWMGLKLESVEDVTHNTKKFSFSLPDPEMVSGVFTTSAILTKCVPEGGDGKPVIRPYTPVSPNNAKGHMDLLVKKYEGGPMSTFLHSMTPGQTLDVKGPLPKYWWSPNKHRHVAMVAGGTGITPMWQLIHEIFADPQSRTKVTLVLGNIKEEDILLKKQLQDLENLFPRQFRVFYTLDDPPEGWKGEKGHVTSELLKQVFPEPKEDNIKLFVCGPPGMMKAVSGPKKSPKDQGELSGILKELGYGQDQVYKF